MVDNNYDGKGTVFLMIGGEGEANAGWMVTGAWLKYATLYNALLFQLEHRYYGKSQPTRYVDNSLHFATYVCFLK